MRQTRLMSLFFRCECRPRWRTPMFQRTEHGRQFRGRLYRHPLRARRRASGRSRRSPVHLKQMNWARSQSRESSYVGARAPPVAGAFSEGQVSDPAGIAVSAKSTASTIAVSVRGTSTDWDAYLETLSANTRQKIRRLLKQVDTTGEYRISHSTPETIERDLNTFSSSGRPSGSPAKGDLVRYLVRSNRAMLARSFKAGLLFLPTLWKGDRPLAALATMMDPRKRAFLVLHDRPRRDL